MSLVNLIHGDCLVEMQKIDANSIDLTVTSPPYDNLRTYAGTLEWNFEIFQRVANELYRITKNGGVVVWVVGDATIKGNETGMSFKQALYFKECGFNLYDTMIFQKPPRGAIGSRNAYWSSFEYMFVLSKGLPKSFNPIIDRENKEIRAKEKFSTRDAEGVLSRSGGGYGAYGRRTNIWLYYTGKNLSTKDKMAFDHPAIFPEQLAGDHIISWSKEGDVIFDPFMGSGTTGKMAKLNNRNFIGIEKVSEYFEIAVNRISATEKQEKNNQPDLFGEIA